jgi:hypothetical protein
MREDHQPREGNLGRLPSIAGAGLISVTLLFGCGADAPPEHTVRVTYATTPYIQALFVDETPSTLFPSFAIAPLPPGPMHVRVRDSAAFFENVRVDANLDGTLTAALRTRTTLAPGNYSGSLIVHACKDLDCAEEYAVSESALPYTLTVMPVVEGLPSLDAIIQFDGAIATNVTDAPALPGERRYIVPMVSGQTFEFRPSEPVFKATFSSSHPVSMSLRASTRPGWHLATATLAPELDSATSFFIVRAVDGRRIGFVVQVTR